jgi:hypothetical protein
MIIFNPKDEALRDSYPGMLSLSHKNMLKEAMNHV